MIYAIICIVLAFAYRFRGGGYVATGNDMLVRFVWALCLALASIFIVREIWFPISVIGSALLSLILVPHGYAENAGTWPRPSWVDKPELKYRWPSAWMPQWTEAGWNAAPAWQKQAYDFAQMFCVAFVRGVMVFVPFVLISIFLTASIPWLAVIVAIGTISILQPAAYQIGIHWMKWAGAIIPDGVWAEFLNGAAWGIALLILK